MRPLYVDRGGARFLVLLGLACLLLLPRRAPAAGDGDEATNIRVYQEAHHSVVNITNVAVDYDLFSTPYASESTGSGIILDTHGHILTNHHVVDQAEQLEVTLDDGSKWPAELIGSDPSTDLAVIRVRTPANRLHPIQLGSSLQLQVGQKVLAIGNPFGLEQTLTTGIISSIRRYLKINDIEMERVIQTDAAINPGNSGGPLLDSTGRMIGITTAIFTPSGGNVGIGFAVPVDTVKWVAESLITKGYVAYAWLGLEMQTLTPEYAAALKLPVHEGVLIGRLAHRGPADRAGLRGGTVPVIAGNTRLLIGGDVIIAADGQPVTSGNDLNRFLRTKRPGESIVLTIIRNGARRETTVTLGERPRR